MKTEDIVTIIALILGPLFTSPCHAEDGDCTLNAMKDYIAARYAIHQRKLVPGVHETVDLRRLEEAFCLRFAQRITPPGDTLLLSSRFSTCLKDELKGRSS